MTDYHEWVRNAQRVDARYARPDLGTHAVGYVIGYTERPTLSIVTQNGRDLTWIADLCVPVDAGSDADRMAAFARRTQSREPATMDLATARRIVAEHECRTHGHDWDAILIPKISHLPGAFVCSRCRAKLTVTASEG